MPLWTRSVRASRILARLQDERGIALVMAIGIMFVLTITVSSVMVYTAASAGHANNSNAGQKAYALAEAGVNNAIAQIAVHYPPYVPNPPVAGDSSWVVDPLPSGVWRVLDGIVRQRNEPVSGRSPARAR